MEGVPYRAALGRRTLATKGTQEIEQNLIKIEQINRVGKKQKKHFQMFVALVRASVLSGLGVSLRTGSYAMPITLIT